MKSTMFAFAFWCALHGAASCQMLNVIGLNDEAFKVINVSGQVECEVGLICGNDGNMLKANQTGLAWLRFSNLSTNSLTIPFFLKYGKGNREGSHPNLHVRDKTAYPSFGHEAACIEYKFLSESGSGSTPPCQLPVGPDRICLEPQTGMGYVIPITAPRKEGKYKLSVRISNENVRKANDSYNFTPYKHFHLINLNVVSEEFEIRR